MGMMRSAMELHQLRYFCAVVKVGSFTKAADLEGVTSVVVVRRGWSGEAGPCGHRRNEDQGQRQQTQGDEL
jgi:hypothetical protein